MKSSWRKPWQDSSTSTFILQCLQHCQSSRCYMMLNCRSMLLLCFPSVCCSRCQSCFYSHRDLNENTVGGLCPNLALKQSIYIYIYKRQSPRIITFTLMLKELGAGPLNIGQTMVVVASQLGHKQVSIATIITNPSESSIRHKYIERRAQCLLLSQLSS